MLAFALTHANANAQDASSDLQKIAKTNSLDIEGKSPFHLKVTYEMYSLDGKLSDTGTVEEWWADAGRSKIVVTAASMKSTEAVPLDRTSGIDPRELYLVENLLSSFVHPVAITVSPQTLKTEERDRAFPGITLKCFNVAPSAAQGTDRQLFSYCAEKNTAALRFELEGTLASTARNQVGNFHDTEVALAIKTAYGGRVAITGKVVTMQVFDPAASDVQLTEPATAATSMASPQAGGVFPGHSLTKVQPVYPIAAKMAHTSGTVVLHATISKEGKVTNLFPLASPSELLTASALDAVKQWRYQQFLLNGKPTEVDTLINVNFMPSR